MAISAEPQRLLAAAMEVVGALRRDGAVPDDMSLMALPSECPRLGVFIGRETDEVQRSLAAKWATIKATALYEGREFFIVSYTRIRTDVGYAYAGISTEGVEMPGMSPAGWSIKRLRALKLQIFLGVVCGNGSPSPSGSRGGAD